MRKPSICITRSILIFSASILIASCSNRRDDNTSNNSEETNSQHIENSEFQSIIDAAGVKGAVLIYDLQKDIYYSNDFEWAGKGNLPASTFKIPNSMIALESSVVENDSTLFKWDGSKRAMKNWEQDLIFRDAFHFSCVPCYQDVARRIGEKRMNDYLEKLDYGNMKVDSTNIDRFWLAGDSRINQFQQIDFLRRFYTSTLPISKRTEQIMRGLMVIEDNQNYRLSGKTGWSIRNGNNNGWFVGYVETEDRVYFFATNVAPNTEFNMDMFPMIRKTITNEALKQMDIIE